MLPFYYPFFCILPKWTYIYEHLTFTALVHGQICICLQEIRNHSIYKRPTFRNKFYHYTLTLCWDVNLQLKTMFTVGWKKFRYRLSVQELKYFSSFLHPTKLGMICLTASYFNEIGWEKAVWKVFSLYSLKLIYTNSQNCIKSVCIIIGYIIM